MVVSTGAPARADQPASAVFDELARDYDAHFAVAHRAAYDELAWEHVQRLLPRTSGLVVDAGCGSGRWARRFVGLGHRVIGIDVSRRMVDASRREAIALGGRFAVVESDMTVAPIDVGAGADLVVAMGSLQYVRDPSLALQRFASWVRPGGAVAVLVDSLLALVMELGANGRWDEAIERARTARGLWSPPEAAGRSTEVRLFDRVTLETLATEAGFADVRTIGLLVSFTAGGRDAYSAAQTYAADASRLLDRELAQIPAVADAGKQLLLTARRPEPTS
jgi:SAM-dependent methyltransferase